jgi:hypothetical protein
MENPIILGPDFKKINEPSDSIKKHYAKLYERNQNKFIRRSKLEQSHLGSEFNHDGRTLRLIGSADGDRMVVVDESDNTYYFIHSDIPTNAILNNV